MTQDTFGGCMQCGEDKLANGSIYFWREYKGGGNTKGIWQ